MPQGGDESKSQRYTAEIGGQTRKSSSGCYASKRARFSDGDGIGHEETHHSAQHRGDQADLQADTSRIKHDMDLEIQLDIGEGEVALLILECANEKVGGREDRER